MPMFLVNFMVSVFWIARSDYNPKPVTSSRLARRRQFRAVVSPFLSAPRSSPRLERQCALATAREVEGATRDCRYPGGLFLRGLKPLFVSSNNDSGHVCCVDDRIVVLGTSQLRKINEFVRNLFHFSADWTKQSALLQLAAQLRRQKIPECRCSMPIV